MTEKLHLSIDKIIEMYEAGDSANTIAKHFGVASLTIRHRLHKANVPIRNSESKSHQHTLLDATELRQLYEIDYKPLSAIAKHFGVDAQTIRRNLVLNGIGVRNTGQAKHLRYRLHADTHNRGTLEQPVLGDRCHGSDIGKDVSEWYVWVECERCKQQRWEISSYVNVNKVCAPCGHIIFGETHRGENCPNWRGGLSQNPYPFEFNDPLKREIHKRDGHCCQLCGKHRNEHSLATHHIDYDKENNDPQNLVSLCSSSDKGQPSCHARTNGDREFWQQFLSKLVHDRYYSGKNKKCKENNP